MVEDKVNKKKLNLFMNDMLKAGTLKGFKYFDFYLQGREELIVKVVNEPKNKPQSSPISSPYSELCDLSSSASSTMFNRKYLTLRCNSVGEESLPPASPGVSDTHLEASMTTFLLACYTRYNCAYVWVRNNLERLAKVNGVPVLNSENPLVLRSTSSWKDHDVKVWEVLVDIVRLCTHPMPFNPLEVDFNYFDSLGHQERAIASAAMICYLQRIVTGQTSEHSYSAKVMEDMEKLTKVHFESIRELSQQSLLPVLNEHKLHQQHQNTTYPRKPPSNMFRTQYNASIY